MSKLRALPRILLVVLIAPTTLRAMLMAGPEIISFSVDPANSAIVSITVEDRAHEVLNFTALSTNSGNTFTLAATRPEFSSSRTNASIGARQYILAEGFLLRSEDSGLTWTNTGARRFVHEQTDAAIKRERIEFDQAFRTRVPFRSKFWTPLFILFAVVHSIFIITFLKPARGWFAAIATAFQAAAILLIVWLMLTSAHQAFHSMNNSQWPGRFWNTHAAFTPSLKTGLLMNIAAKPFPLLAYLVPLSLLLPATVGAILHRVASPKIRNRIYSALSLAASVIMLSAHLCFAFVGYFAQ